MLQETESLNAENKKEMGTTVSELQRGPFSASIIDMEELQEACRSDIDSVT